MVTETTEPKKKRTSWVYYCVVLYSIHWTMKIHIITYSAKATWWICLQLVVKGEEEVGECALVLLASVCKAYLYIFRYSDTLHPVETENPEEDLIPRTKVGKKPKPWWKWHYLSEFWNSVAEPPFTSKSRNAASRSSSIRLLGNWRNAIS